MSIFVFPWNALVICGSFLLLLLAREVALTLRLQRGDPEKGFAWFNAMILLILLAVVAGCSVNLMLREKHLADIVPLYPGSRYAPEKELMVEGQDWIFVTSDTPLLVERF